MRKRIVVQGWGAHQHNVTGTDTELGSGKRNTQLIVERLKQLGESNRAAQICNGMEINGFKDWFLPSKVELDLMYKNLKAKDLGGFKSVWYWSSSQNDSYDVWYQEFKFINNGSQDNGGKYHTGSVRAIRAF